MKYFLKAMGGLVAVLVAAFLFLAWASAGFWTISTLRGQLAAKIDISHGQYKVLGYGLPTPWRSNYAALLNSRFGVRYEAVAGCTVTQGIVDYVEAYDKESSSAINRKFGRDVLKEAVDETEKEWAIAHSVHAPTR